MYLFPGIVADNTNPCTQRYTKWRDCKCYRRDLTMDRCAASLNGQACVCRRGQKPPSEGDTTIYEGTDGYREYVEGKG
jgi:hypothetical protein